LTARELKKWLEAQGCKFRPGHNGHLIVELRGRTTTLPMQGNDRLLGSILIGNIKRALGLDHA